MRETRLNYLALAILAAASVACGESQPRTAAEASSVTVQVPEGQDPAELRPAASEVASAAPEVYPGGAQEPQGLQEKSAGSGVPQSASEGSATWSMYRGDASMSGRAAGTLPDKPELLWSFDAGNDILSSPVISAGRVYFGCDDMYVRCLNAVTGEELWSFHTGDIVEAPPLVVDDTLYIGSSNGIFYALDAESGALRWQYATEDSIQAGANFDRGGPGLRIVFASYDNRLYCLDGKSGESLWIYDTENRANGTPAIQDGKAYFAGCDAILHEVSMDTGKALKQVPLGGEGQVTSSVALMAGRAYFGFVQEIFVCIDLESEQVLWQYQGRNKFQSSAAISGKRVVFGGGDRLLHCVELDTGKALWSFPTRKAVDGSPVIVGDKVLFGSFDGRVYLVGLEDGKELWSHDLGKAIVASPAVQDGRFYVGGTDGFLYAFGRP